MKKIPMKLKFLGAAALLAAASLAGAASPRASRAALEPQRHFASAVEAYAQKNYKAAAGEIRAATGELRREAGRASGDARRALDSSVAELDKLADSIGKGTLGAEQSMRVDFARAEHALALEHRAKASEAWSHKRYKQAGTELKAAAARLESAAAWTGGEAKAGAAAAVSDARALGDKLASGAKWSRDEVASGFKSLSQAIDTLGRNIASRG
jgi:hypothetical protein